jgi:hypothetical protein
MKDKVSKGLEPPEIPLYPPFSKGEILSPPFIKGRLEGFFLDG